MSSAERFASIAIFSSAPVKLVENQIDYQKPLDNQVEKLNDLAYTKDTRLTIIDKEGNVLADSDKEGIQENHSGRSEFKEALSDQFGYATRYSSTVKMNMMYVAYYHRGYVVRIAIPYIKNISSVYKNLADDILPQLRRSRLTLNYEIIGKSDEEITKLASSNPSELNIEELLYAATLTNDPAKQEAIYTQATKQFPNDYRAYNNLGKLAYQAGNVDKAESYLKKAASVNAAPEVNMNLGLISLIKGDKAAAEAYFGKAAGTKELGESMGNLYIAQGQYERAVNSFGDAKTNSAALAQILAKDYNKAKNTLAGVEKPDAYTDYLMAVLGARTNNSSMVTSSLKSAVAKEPALAKKAATDLEFSKFFTNADFMSIIK